VAVSSFFARSLSMGAKRLFRCSQFLGWKSLGKSIKNILSN